MPCGVNRMSCLRHEPQLHNRNALSYSLRDKDKIVRYIMRQKEHHGATTFADEYRAFIEENGAPIDEQYFLKDE